MLALGGTSRYDMSVCHTASPSPRLPIASPDFRQTLDEPAAIFLDRRPVKIAEAAAECDQVLIAQRLPANQQDRMLVPGVHQASEHPVVEVSQINASHLGSERRASRNHVERA